MKFIPYTGSTYLNENDQESGIHFAVLNKVPKEQTYKIVTPWFKCRDYLQDVWSAQYGGKDFEKYGFHTEGVRIQRRIYLLMNRKECAVPEDDQGENWRKRVLMYVPYQLNLLEKSAGISMTKVIPVDNDRLFISASIDWFKYPWAISLLTLILRNYSLPCFKLHWLENPQEALNTLDEHGYWSDHELYQELGDVTKLIELLPKIGKGLISKTKVRDLINCHNLDKLHNNSGIASLYESIEDYSNYDPWGDLYKNIHKAVGFKGPSQW